MRRILIATLLLGLASCHSVRAGLGEYQKAADRGIGVNVSAQDEAASNAGTIAPAPLNKRDGYQPGGTDKQAGLPVGLGGDKAHGAYLEPAPR